MPNQGKIQQEDGQAFSTNDTKFRYRTQNNGSPLAHAQVDSNFEIIRLTANGLVDDIKSNYDMVQLNKASIASLENRASELENKTSVNANDIAVNGVKIADNLEKIEVLNLLTAAQGVDLEANEEAIAVNATAILNLDTKTADADSALDTRVTNNETSIESLTSSTTTNANDISSLKDAVQLSAQAIDANTGSIDTINTTLSDHDSRILSNDTDINSNKLATEANALAISTNLTNLQNADASLDSKISSLKTESESADADLDSRLFATSTLLQTTVEYLDHFSGTSDTTLADIDSTLSSSDGRLATAESELDSLGAAVERHYNLLLPADPDTGNRWDRFKLIEDRVTALETNVAALITALSSTNSNVQTVADSLTTVTTTVSNVGGGYFSTSQLVNSGTGTKNTTVTVSTYSVPSTAKWGIFWTYNEGDDYPSHQTYVFPNSSFTNGAMVYYNASDKSQWGGVQFFAPIVDGKCYIKSQENSTDSWKLYMQGWA